MPAVTQHRDAARTAQRGAGKSTKRAAPVAPAGPTRLETQVQMQQDIERLTTENAKLTLAASEASEGHAAAQEDLEAAEKREGALSDLLSSAGCDTVALGPLSWSLAEAQQLLDDDEQCRAALQVRPACPQSTLYLACAVASHLLYPHLPCLDARRRCRSELAAGAPAPKNSSRHRPSCTSSCRRTRRWRQTEDGVAIR